MATTEFGSFSMSNIKYDLSTLDDSISVKKDPLKILPDLPIVLFVAATVLTSPVWEDSGISRKLTSSHNEKYAISMPGSITRQNKVIDFSLGIEGSLYSFLDYGENWDGYGGIAPSTNAVADAILFFNKLGFDAREPRPGLSGDGEIGLYWKFDSVFIDIGFLGDGKYAMYAKDGEGIEYFKDEILLTEPLPGALLNLITIK